MKLALASWSSYVLDLFIGRLVFGYGFILYIWYGFRRRTEAHTSLRHHKIKYMNLEVVKDLVIPQSATRGGARGSRYFDNDLANALAKLEVGGGVTVPLGLTSPEVKNPANRQRYAMDYRIKEWAKDSGRHYKTFVIPAVGKDGEANFTPERIGIKLISVDEKQPAEAAK